MPAEFALSTKDIIEAAARKIGEFDAGEPMESEDTADFLLQLNAMTAEWKNRGDRVWARLKHTLWLNKGQQVYTLGNGDTDAYWASNFTETLVSVAATAGTGAYDPSGTTPLSVTSTTGMSANDFLGVELDDCTYQWTKICSVIDGVNLELQDNVTQDIAVGRKVVAFTTRSRRPRKILHAARVLTSGIEIPVDIIGRVEYERLTQKDMTGSTTQVHYQPSLNAGDLYVWPTGDNDTRVLTLVTEELFTDLDAVADTPQFPIEWGNALIWNLAYEMGPEYDVDEIRMRRLERMAERKLDDARDYDQEDASVQFEVDRQQ